MNLGICDFKGLLCSRLKAKWRWLGCAIVVASSSILYGIDPGLYSWTQIGVGAGASGSAGESGQHLTVTATGQRIDGRVDSFYFTARKASAGAEITARVGDLGGAQAAGIMVRNLMAPDSPNVFFGVSASDGAAYLSWRSEKRGTTSSVTLADHLAPTDWLRLVPEQSTVYAYTSTDGVSWAPLMAVELAMPNLTWIGVAAASGGGSSTVTRFDAVRFSHHSGYRVEVR